MTRHDSLTPRQQWQNAMSYRHGEFDRPQVIHWTCWDETFARWKREGLPDHVRSKKDLHAYFNAKAHFAHVGFNVTLYPGFETRIVEETDEYTIFWNWEGVLLKDLKHAGSVPHYMDFSFKTADDWPRYKERLQIDTARIRPNLDELIFQEEADGRPLGINTGSMMGWIRNWMGVEGMSYLMCDDPDCFADIIATLSDLVCWQLDTIIPRMSAPPDLGFGWEDIAGSSGPFVSPSLFDELVAPGYRKIRNRLDEHGCHILGLDSDGKVEPLIENWMAAGVNLMFPIEPGTWGASPEAFRARFGKGLLMQGGFDKFALERGRKAIDAEIERHIPLLKEGGYMMMPDHIISPDVPLADYQYYLDRIRNLRY